MHTTSGESAELKVHGGSAQGMHSFCAIQHMRQKRGGIDAVQVLSHACHAQPDGRCNAHISLLGSTSEMLQLRAM